MLILANILVGGVAALHLYFLVLEMFLWKKPYGLRVFGLDQATANSSAVLAANQGLYNGFLAAGLIWGIFSCHSDQARGIKIFFLTCVIVAGIYGGKTVNKKIFFVQALPALITLAVVYFAT